MIRSWVLILFISWPCVLRAQESMVDIINRQLAENRSSFPGMRPHVFFTQDKYAPGDTAFFRIFILTEDERILNERFLLTLELVNPKGLFVIRQHIACAKGGAANQLILPDALSPGYYEVRVYNDRMNMAYGLSQRLLIAGEKKLVPVPGAEESIQIFPEGGHLVAGGVNRLVVRSFGQIVSEAYLRSDQGRISPVTFDKDGFASAQFVPQPGGSYSLEYKSHLTSSVVPVPGAKPTDLTIRVYAGPRKAWILDVMSGPEGPKDATLLLVAQRQIFHSQGVHINATGRMQILVAPDFFPEGFSEIFILDPSRRLLAYRPVYQATRSKGTIEFSGVPPECGFRQEIKTALKVRDASGNPVTGAFAVSVVPTSTTSRPVVAPDPSVVLHSNPPISDWNQPLSRIEMELIARPIPEKVIQDYPPLLLQSNISLSGRAFYSDSTAALPFLSKMIIYLHKDLIRYETGIDGRGYFQFPKIFDFFGRDRAYYKVVQENKEVRDVSVDWSVNTEDHQASQEEKTYSLGEEPDEYAILRRQKRSIDRSYGHFLSPDGTTKRDTNPNVSLEDEFQEADITIIPREYTPFETMQELILEVIPSLLFRKNARDSTVRVTLMTHSPFVAQRYADGNPLYIIDGWMTSDTRFFMSISPREIVSFKIINEIGKLDRLGNLARNGVVFIHTDFPEKAERHLAKDLVMVDGLSPTLISKPRISDNRRIPDLRTLLFWTPHTEADSTGTLNFNFHTSDMPGAYSIRVVGTTANGHILTGEQVLLVKRKK